MFEGTSCINDPIIISPDLAFRAEATTGEGSIWHPDRNTLFWVCLLYTSDAADE